MTDCRRISMWSGPRNISTALMYSFRQRPDTKVFDEPLYAHYLATTGLRHPGYRDVLAAQDQDGARVTDEVLYGPCERPVLFFKNMAHHMVGLDLDRFDGLTNIFLTREPADMLTSLIKELPEADLEATGLPSQIRLLDRIEAKGAAPVVLMAADVLRNPEGVLRSLCDRIGIPWYAEMLAWPEGPKPEDGVWAPHWYANVHRSTGFAPYRPKDEVLPAHVEPLLAECLPLYERLATHAIRA